MDALTKLLTWQSVAVTVAACLAGLVFYRLFLDPLAQFPGPKLAAITRYYEAYYDLIQNGQYTFKIAELHKEYGPIIRISPYELHIIDPTFFEKLYRQDGVWNKYAWSYRAFTADGASICTVDHHLHKARRQPLNPFFSKAKVAGQQDLILRRVEKTCGRMAEFAESRTLLNLGAAFSAFTLDVATEFILGINYENSDKDDFNFEMANVVQESGKMWLITKHVPWYGPALRSIPVGVILKVADAGTRAFFRFLEDIKADTKALMADASLSSSNRASRTIIHEMLDSNLPPAEKAFQRVFDDVVTTSSAGFETVASVLRLVVYHIFSNDDILQRLRAEIDSAVGPGPLELKKIERLPFLTSVLMEGLRLSPALASRMARIAPEMDIVYGTWRIPAGTPVGMTTILMHTDENLYPDPMRFNPDRWMDPDARKRSEKTYAPFSRGTRSCLGMYLAWAEMYLIVTAIVQRFDFRFHGVTAKDFECASDQFTIGTKGRDVLNATVTLYNSQLQH